MQSDRRGSSRKARATSLGSQPSDPLDRLAAEHTLELELCEALEDIADGLPSRLDRNLIRMVVNVLAHGVSAHFEFEEEALFPMLRRRASSGELLIAALDQLAVEHRRDAGMCGELAEELRYCLLRERPRNPEMLGYMLRGFFEGQRRHVEWENSVVLPAARRLLTEQDRQELTRYIQHCPRPTASLRDPRRGRQM